MKCLPIVFGVLGLGAGAMPGVGEAAARQAGPVPSMAAERAAAPAPTARDNSRPVTSLLAPLPAAAAVPAPLIEPGRSVMDTVGDGNGNGGGGVQDVGITMIDMEFLQHNDANSHDAGREYLEDGFVLSVDQLDAFDFYVDGTQSGDYCGSTAMYNNTVGGTTYLYALDYTPFSLEFMEFANLSNNGPATVTVHGVKEDGTEVTHVCTLEHSDYREETFYFPGFNDLFYVYWTQDAPYHQFDNIGVVRAPIVLDFQTLEAADNGSHDRGHSVYEDGFVIDNSNDSLDLYTFGTLNPKYPGSTALFDNTADGTMTLTQYGGGTFNLHSIDIASLNNDGPVTVKFVGHRPGGSTVTRSYTTAGGPNDLETFEFGGFNNLDSVTWTQDAPFHQFDNIVLSRGQQTLDFAKLTQYDDQSHVWGHEYRQDGFRIRTGPDDNDLDTFGVYEPRFAGSTALYNNTINGTNHLEAIDGAQFQMLGIEIANLNGDGPTTVHFTGHKEGGGQLDKEVTTSGPGLRLETFEFGQEWRGLKDVEWTQAAPFHQFDNVRLVRQTTLMDCQKVEHADDLGTAVGPTYTENGFRLSKGPNDTYGFYSYGTKAPNYNGSTSVFNNTGGGSIRLTAVDGGDFDLLQMDLSSLSAGLGNVTVTFLGTKADNTQVSQTFNIDGTWLIEQTCRFVGFDNLKYVDWTQDFPYHQIDNIVAVESAEQEVCYPDCNGDGALDLFDFLCFVNDFNASGAYSNCDGNGSHDLFDFLCYVNAFNAGC